MVRRKLPIGIQTFRKPREDGCYDNVYLFEFKVVELAGEGAAMAQLRSRGYADKYRHLGPPVHLVAVECTRDARNVAAFEVVRA